LDLLGKIVGKIIRLRGEILFGRERRGPDRSRQQACGQACSHGAPTQDASKRIAATDLIHWLAPLLIAP
jgi:hypothetical protein